MSTPAMPPDAPTREPWEQGPPEWFGDEPDSAMTDDVSDRAGSAPSARVRVEGAWKADLLYRQLRGKPTTQLRPVTANITKILTGDDRWHDVIAYDEFAEDVIATKPPPWRACDAPEGGAKAGDWNADDLTRLQAWLSTEYDLDAGADAIASAVHVVAKRRRVHPVRAWLDSLRWDGKKRLDTWLHDVMGCEDTRYSRAVGRAWAISAVARAYKPGCKVDTVLVLEGKPGSFKSSVLRALVGDAWFFEMNITDVANKDAMQILRRKWIAEFPEIDSLQKYEQASVKAYFSRQVDRYRPSFGKGAGDFPRQTIFAATTNKSDWITDETGGTGRRMWPVWCERGDVALMHDVREQFWAEARARFESGEAWHITDPLVLADERNEQADRLQTDVWLPAVAAWLQDPIGWTWEENDAGKRRQERYRIDLTHGVRTIDLAQFAVEKPLGQVTRADQMRLGAVLVGLGYERGPQRRENGAVVRRFVKRSPPSPPSPPDANEGGDR